MIGKLSGTIDSFGERHILLDVQGVGYIIFVSTQTIRNIGETGERASLLIDTHVREDHIHLYGFLNAAEQTCFRLLTSVQGVGAKVGLALLSSSSPEQLQLAILAQDKALITSAEGVGPKLATRILTELKDKVGSIDVHSFQIQTSEGQSSQNQKENLISNTNAHDQDAISALVHLGYGKAEAFSAIMKVKSSAQNNESYPLEDLIRLSLKALSS